MTNTTNTPATDLELPPLPEQPPCLREVWEVATKDRDSLESEVLKLRAEREKWRERASAEREKNVLLQAQIAILEAEVAAPASAGQAGQVAKGEPLTWGVLDRDGRMQVSGSKEYCENWKKASAAKGTRIIGLVEGVPATERTAAARSERIEMSKNGLTDTEMIGGQEPVGVTPHPLRTGVAPVPASTGREPEWALHRTVWHGHAEEWKPVRASHAKFMLENAKNSGDANTDKVHEVRWLQMLPGTVSVKRGVVTDTPVAARELDVEAERLLRECKRFMEDMHAMSVEWTIKESQVLHQKVSNALAARSAAQGTVPVSTEQAGDAPVGYVDPQSLRNFEAGVSTHEWLWRGPADACLIPLFTRVAPSPNNSPVGACKELK